MTAWTVIFYPANILESGTVTVTGTPDTGYPAARLYDRDRTLYWKDSVTEAKVFHVDQGATGILDVDALFVGRHNFSGADMQWQYSDNDVDWSDAVDDWTQADNELIAKVLGAAIEHRYWQLTLSSMADPQCAEIFMSAGYTFNPITAMPGRGPDAANVRWQRTVGGIERSTKFGDTRRTRQYTFKMSAVEFASFATVLGYLNDYARPFFIKDHLDNYFMARFDGEPEVDFNHNTHTQVTVRLIEKL